MPISTGRLHLLRFALALVTLALLVLAVRHYRVVRELDTLRAERTVHLVYIHALERKNGEMNAVNPDLTAAQNEQARAITPMRKR